MTTTGLYPRVCAICGGPITSGVVVAEGAWAAGLDWTYYHASCYHAREQWNQHKEDTSDIPA